jgi:hypothetical protein
VATRLYCPAFQVDFPTFLGLYGDQGLQIRLDPLSFPTGRLSDDPQGVLEFIHKDLCQLMGLQRDTTYSGSGYLKAADVNITNATAATRYRKSDQTLGDMIDTVEAWDAIVEAGKGLSKTSRGFLEEKRRDARAALSRQLERRSAGSWTVPSSVIVHRGKAYFAMADYSGAGPDVGSFEVKTAADLPIL